MTTMGEYPQTPEGFIEVPGFEGRYAVSNSGEVYNIRRAFIMKQHRRNTGYLSVHIRRNGEKRKVWLVQYLVVFTFIGPRPNGMDVDHINRKRDDNRLENLRYATRSQNSHNTIGRKVLNTSCFRGVIFRHHRAKTKPWIPTIRHLRKRIWGKYFSTPREAAIAYDDMAKQFFGTSAITNASLGLL